MYCAVKHNCHELTGSAIHLCGYSAIYAGHLFYSYSSTHDILKILQSTHEIAHMYDRTDTPPN